jgi:diadenosine tetraphosphatase ApaH/serine/threonine PP2A family protein phosphatase
MDGAYSTHGEMRIAYNTKVYPEGSGLAAWSENCKWYSSLPLGAVVSLFYEPV